MLALSRPRFDLNGMFESPLPRMIDEFMGAGQGGVDVWEDEDAYHVEADVPGAKAADVEITASGRELSIVARREDAKKEGVTWHARANRPGSMSRRISLPEEADASKAEASLEAGVLRVRIPKSDEARPRRIEVKPV